MRFTWFILCLLLSVSAFAQTQSQQLYSKAQLEAKRKEYQDAINETEKELSAIKKDKNATLGQLRALQTKLAQRQSLIGNINDEISNIESTIKTSSKEVVNLKLKLEQLKIRYAQSIRYAYETRSSFGMLAFLFSSSDFNDAIRRMKYLKKFRDFRKQQVEQIRATQNQLQHKIGELNVTKAQKDELLGKEVQQKQELQKETNQTNDVINQLKGKEKELMSNIEKNRIVANRINKAIQVYIEAEMAKEAKKAEEAQKAEAAKAAAIAKTNPVPVKVPEKTNPAKPGENVPTPVIPKPKAPRPEVSLMLTPADAALADKFEANKGKLPWPVEKGIITDHFGSHPHALYKQVMITNNGIDIQTDENAPIRAVFEGEVTNVFTADGSTQIVMIKHGNFFTLYNGLANTTLKVGDHIALKQVIGHVGKNIEDLPVINFQVWKSSGSKKARTNLNPEAWISKLR